MNIHLTGLSHGAAILVFAEDASGSICHINLQLQYKEKQVRDNLTRIGKIDLA